MKTPLKFYFLILVLIFPVLGFFIGSSYNDLLIEHLLKIEVHYENIVRHFYNSFGFSAAFLAAPITTWIIYSLRKENISTNHYHLMPFALCISGFLFMFIRILYLNWRAVDFLNKNIDSAYLASNIALIKYFLIGIMFTSILIWTISFNKRIERPHNNKYKSAG